MEYRWHLRCNRPCGWRQRLAQRLHALAARLDGRWCLAIEIRSAPPLERDRQAAVLRAALKRVDVLLGDECRAAAVECWLRRYRPGLYGDRATQHE